MDEAKEEDINALEFSGQFKSSGNEITAEYNGTRRGKYKTSSLFNRQPSVLTQPFFSTGVPNRVSNPWLMVMWVEL